MEKETKNDADHPQHDRKQNPQPSSTPLGDRLDTDRSTDVPNSSRKQSVYAGLGWLDRLLVLWILLAIVIGIVLGNFVDGIGPALQRGKFVDVSVPIGRSHTSNSLSLII
jgi:arsenite transporter